MAYTARTREEIRSDLLDALTNRYAAVGRALDVSEGSDAYMRADALAVILATFSQQAAQQAQDAFVDTASDAAVERHAAVYAIERRPASPSTLTVSVTGTPSVTISISAGAKLSGADGSLFTCSDTSVVMNGAGIGTITMTADTAGVAGNLAIGAIVSWQSAPSGIDPTATVATTVTSGEDAETANELRLRVLSRLRQRPASGNVEDWRDWCESCDGVTRAFVYPLLEPVTVSGDKLGCVTVVVMGPAQGDNPTNSAVISSARCDEIKDYIEGIRDTAGAFDTAATQLRPASIAADDYEISFIGVAPTDVEANIATTSRFPFSFTGTLTVDGASTASSLIVTGDETAKTGKIALCRVATTSYRGGWQATELKNGSYNGGTNKTTFTVSLAAAPNTTTAYPAPANWAALRTAIFALFDSLGPRDTTPPRRWPTVDVLGADTLYVSAIVSALLGVGGVTSATVTQPATDYAPSDAKQIPELRYFLVTETP